VDTFEVIVSDCPDQVNLFLLTPEPAQIPQPGPTGVEEKMWMVATEDRCQEIFDDIPPAYNPSLPGNIPGVNDAKLLRLWGY
jgi:hypothetical protein